MQKLTIEIKCLLVSSIYLGFGIHLFLIFIDINSVLSSIFAMFCLILNLFTLLIYISKSITILDEKFRWVPQSFFRCN